MACLPFPLPRVSRGFAALTPEVRAGGARLASAVASALTEVVGATVVIAGRAVPAVVTDLAGSVRVAIPLSALAATASLELDVALLARTLERMSRRVPRTPAAAVPCELESALLVLVTLVATDVARVHGAAPLAPVVALDPPAGPAATSDGLAVMLDVRVGEDRGCGRLVVPAAALEALRGPPQLPAAVAGLEVWGSLRERTATLAPDDLVALAPGDVVLLDEGPTCAEMVLPGGLALQGRIEAQVLHVEELRMTEAQAAYPITLSVEIARVRLTLAELARLEPGAALALDARKDGAVVLRAGEHPVARGQLVEIDGALGVRIAQIGNAP